MFACIAHWLQQEWKHVYFSRNLLLKHIHIYDYIFLRNCRRMLSYFTGNNKVATDIQDLIYRPPHHTHSPPWSFLYYLIYLTLHWPILMNNPLIFVSFTLSYSRGIHFVINKYCLYQSSSMPVKYRSGIGVWLRCVWFGFNPPLGNIFF